MPSGEVLELAAEKPIELRFSFGQQLVSQIVFAHGDGMEQHHFSFEVTRHGLHIACRTYTAIGKINREQNSLDLRWSCHVLPQLSSTRCAGEGADDRGGSLVREHQLNQTQLRNGN